MNDAIVIEPFLRVNSVSVESSLPFLATRAEDEGGDHEVGRKEGRGRGCDALEADLGLGGVRGRPSASIGVEQSVRLELVKKAGRDKVRSWEGGTRVRGTVCCERIVS